MEKRVRAIASHAPSPWFPVYYAVVVGGGLLLLALNASELTGTSWGLALLWLALIIGTDAAPVNLPGGGFITVSSTVDYAGILILGPVPVAFAEFIATVVLQLGVQRKPLHKVLFNAATFSGTVLVAGWVYLVLGGTVGGPLDFPQALVPIVGMGVTYYALNTTLVSLVLALSERRKAWQIWQVNYIWTIFHMVASLPFGAALAVAHAALGVWGVLLFVLPLMLARYVFKLYTEAKRDLVDFAGVLAGMIDEFDPYTCMHSQRVSRYSAQIAREMGLSEREVERAEVAGLLHDIGKISVTQRELVLKPGPLTPEERKRVNQHADIGAEILDRVRAFRHLAPMVRYHHERMDGDGYHGLPEDEVPLTSKVVMVADAFDAMTTDRVYRPALGLAAAVQELERHNGTQFHPPAVAALIRLIERREVRVDAHAPEATEVLAHPEVVNASVI